MRLRQRGFSLLELVMFIVIVGIALSAIAAVFSTNVANSANPLIREKTIKLANLYMDEIMGMRWDESTPTGGGCIETGSAYCNNYCAALTPNFPNCDFCTRNNVLSTCDAPATIVAMGANEEALRSDFDDIDDYSAGFLSATPSSPDALGINGETPLPDVAGYTVAVAINAVALNGTPATDVRQIIVTVTNPLNDTLTLTRYRVNF